jgi:hypothetical protein
VGPMPYGITWLLMPLRRAYIIHHDQSGFSRLNHKGKRGENEQYSQRSKAISIFKA